MSQNELHTIIHQQQEQLIAIQVQIQTLLAAGGERTGGVTAGPHVEVAKPAVFGGEAGKVGEFVNTCKLYIRMKMEGATVVEQVYWILSHVQGGSADIWKENVMEELEAGKVEYKIAEKFLMSLKKKFGREEEAVKAVKLRKLR